LHFPFHCRRRRRWLKVGNPSRDDDEVDRSIDLASQIEFFLMKNYSLVQLGRITGMSIVFFCTL